MTAKKRKVKKSKPINYDIGPAYSATSKSRSIADKKYHHKASGSGLDSKLYQNPDGSYTRKSVDSSPAEYEKGGRIEKKPPVYGDYDVSNLLELLESPVARARGIESPQNTTFRVLKKLAEDTNPGRRENTLIPDYEARAMMGRDRTPERLKAGMGGFNLDKTALYGLIRYLTGNQR